MSTEQAAENRPTMNAKIADRIVEEFGAEDFFKFAEYIFTSRLGGFAFKLRSIIGIDKNLDMYTIRKLLNLLDHDIGIITDGKVPEPEIMTIEQYWSLRDKGNMPPHKILAKIPPDDCEAFYYDFQFIGRSESGYTLQRDPDSRVWDVTSNTLIQVEYTGNPA